MRIVLVVLILSVFGGCVPALLRPEAEILKSERIESLIKSNQERHQRLAGKFKMRGTGLNSLFGSVDVSIALQQPSSLYLALPSFFGSPARVVTSDGKNNYVLDLTEKDPAYLVEPASARTLQRWMGFDIQPRELVHAMLGILDLKDGVIKDIRLDRRQARYIVKVQYSDGRECIASFDADTDELYSQSVYKNGDKIYAVIYSDFRDTKVGRFAWHNEVTLKGDKGSAKLAITAEELKFDDKAYDVDTFQIEEP